MRRIKFGSEFRLRYALAIEFVCHRKYTEAQRSGAVTTMNSVRTVSYFARQEARPKKSSVVADECQA